MHARLKFAVSRLIPMPSVIVSKGLRSRLPSASSRVYITPRVTLLYSPLPGGSTRNTRTCAHGFAHMQSGGGSRTGLEVWVCEQRKGGSRTGLEV
eukprot:355983-Chlamydomonas_euryale.AAC.6